MPAELARQFSFAPTANFALTANEET